MNLYCSFCKNLISLEQYRYWRNHRSRRKRNKIDNKREIFCSQECFRKNISFNTKTTKICKKCGKEKERRATKCKKCHDNRAFERIEKGLPAGKNAIRRYYIIKYKNRCMSSDCCWDFSKKEVILELHHIDGNNKNNVLKNCILLCPNCHSLTENWKFRKN